MPDITRSPTGTVTDSSRVDRDALGARGHRRASADLECPPDPDFDWIAVADICQDALRLVHEKAEQQQVGLDRAFDTRLRLVLGDRRLLVSLLVTLLTETQKHAAPGSHVGIETSAHVARDVVAITVSLRSPGRARVPSTLPPLVTLSQLLSPLGGSLWHEATTAGARTIVEIPWGLRGTCARTVELAMQSGVSPDRIWEAPAPPPRLLLIYRDTESGSRLAEVLGAEGYDPLLLGALPARGADALRVRPDALLVDSGLARELQTDLVDIVRDETGLHRVPVLVTVRSSDLSLDAWLTGSPRSACVHEPFDRRALTGTLGWLLGDQLSLPDRASGD